MKEDTREWLLKVAQSLLPKFYNRITWTVVIAGLGLICTPAWERVLDAILRGTVHVTLFGFWDPVIGCVLVALALAYNGFIQWATLVHSRDRGKEEEQNTSEHDKRVFLRFEKTCSERTLARIIEHIGTHHATGIQQLRPLRDLVRESTLVENAFLDEALTEAFSQFIASLEILLCTITREFFTRLDFEESSDEWSLRMRPDWNMDLDGSGEADEIVRYEKAREGLKQTLDDLERAYKAYRIVIKQHLKI